VSTADAQTLSEHFTDVQIWNMDYHLAEYIGRGIREFAKFECGIPYGFTKETWDAALDEMASGFEAWAQDATRKDAAEKLERSLDLLRENFTGLWF
jgi:hypothetical protein